MTNKLDENGLLQALEAIIDRDENNFIADQSNNVSSWQSDELCILLDNAREAVKQYKSRAQPIDKSAESVSNEHFKKLINDIGFAKRELEKQCCRECSDLAATRLAECEKIVEQLSQPKQADGVGGDEIIICECNPETYKQDDYFVTECSHSKASGKSEGSSYAKWGVGRWNLNKKATSTPKQEPVNARPTVVNGNLPQAVFEMLTDLAQLTHHYAGGTQFTHDPQRCKAFLRKHHHTIRNGFSLSIVERAEAEQIKE